MNCSQTFVSYNLTHSNYNFRISHSENGCFLVYRRYYFRWTVPMIQGLKCMEGKNPPTRIQLVKKCLDTEKTCSSYVQTYPTYPDSVRATCESSSFYDFRIRMYSGANQYLSGMMWCGHDLCNRVFVDMFELKTITKQIRVDVLPKPNLRCLINSTHSEIVADGRLCKYTTERLFIRGVILVIWRWSDPNNPSFFSYCKPNRTSNIA